MSPNSIALRRLRAANALPRRLSRLERLRVRLGDGARTTLHVASYERDAYIARLVALEEPMPLARWCAKHGASDALVGGFFIRASYAPLGDVRIGGAAMASVPFDWPWSERRACVHIDSAELRIARRNQLADDLQGDLLQAGPLLVLDRRRMVQDGEDPEGFSAGAHQFDSDITRGRYPRAALGLTNDRLLAVACDGRRRRDAGMTLVELADALIELGAVDALNLDGGGSASLVHQGRLRNRPREPNGVDLLDGRPVATALVFEPVQ
jgi:hypothetical protein